MECITSQVHAIAGCALQTLHKIPAMASNFPSLPYSLSYTCRLTSLPAVVFLSLTLAAIYTVTIDTNYLHEVILPTLVLFHRSARFTTPS